MFPVADWAVFTVGRLPIDVAAREAIEQAAERVAMPIPNATMSVRFDQPGTGETVG